jgi:hypothetical protein
MYLDPILHALGIAILEMDDAHTKYRDASHPDADGALLTVLANRYSEAASVMRVRALQAAPMIRSFLSKEPTVPPFGGSSLPPPPDEELEAPLPTYGAVQGIIYSLQKEAERPNFLLRELSTGAFVSCYYPTRLYTEVARALQERTNILNVAGKMNYDRATRSIAGLQVERIETARMLSAAEFEGLFGSMPDFTGSHSTDEWIDAIRSDDR